MDKAQNSLKFLSERNQWGTKVAANSCAPESAFLHNNKTQRRFHLKENPPRSLTKAERGKSESRKSVARREKLACKNFDLIARLYSLTVGKISGCAVPGEIQLSNSGEQKFAAKAPRGNNAFARLSSQALSRHSKLF
jgi:hypothetical protein